MSCNEAITCWKQIITYTWLRRKNGDTKGYKGIYHQGLFWGKGAGEVFAPSWKLFVSPCDFLLVQEYILIITNVVQITVYYIVRLKPSKFLLFNHWSDEFIIETPWSLLEFFNTIHYSDPEKPFD